MSNVLKLNAKQKISARRIKIDVTNYDKMLSDLKALGLPSNKACFFINHYFQYIKDFVEFESLRPQDIKILNK